MLGWIVQLREHHESIGNLDVTLGWLLWLIPSIGVVAIVLYVLVVTFGFDVPAMLMLIAAGHWGDVFAYVLGVTGWGLSQSGRALGDFWPVVMIGGTLTLLVWIVRSL